MVVVGCVLFACVLFDVVRCSFAFVVVWRALFAFCASLVGGRCLLLVVRCYVVVCLLDVGVKCGVCCMLCDECVVFLVVCWSLVSAVVSWFDCCSGLMILVCFVMLLFVVVSCRCFVVVVVGCLLLVGVACCFSVFVCVFACCA